MAVLDTLLAHDKALDQGQQPNRGTQIASELAA
jgi:hypothetical protein